MPLGFRGLQAPGYRPPLAAADKKSLPNLQVTQGDQVCFSARATAMPQRENSRWFRSIQLFSRLFQALLSPLRWPLEKLGLIKAASRTIALPTPIHARIEALNPFAVEAPKLQPALRHAENSQSLDVFPKAEPVWPDSPKLPRPVIKPFAGSPFRRVVYSGIPGIHNRPQQFWNAVLAGKRDTVQKFLDEGMDVNYPQADGRTALYEAAGRGDLPMVQTLLSAKKINIEAEDRRGTRAIHRAVIENHPDVVDALLAKKVDLEAHSWYENRPLQLAANLGHTEIAKKLVRHGAEVNGQSWLGSTPLYWAAGHGHLSIVKDLLAHGAKVTILNHYQETPLHAAAKGGHKAVMLALLAADGADPNAPDGNEETPMHRAATHDKPEVLEILKAHGGSLSLRSLKGQTPQEILDKRRQIRAAKPDAMKPNFS